MRERVSRALGLGEGEAGRAARLVALIFVLSAALVMIKSAQNGIFLLAYPKTMIPWAFFVSAIALSAASLATVPLASKLGAGRLLRVTLLACALALLAARALLAAGVPAAPFVLYVVVESVAGVLLINGWAVVSQATTARSAKRLLPVAGAGATLAWTFVGLAVVPLAHRLGAPALLVLAAALLIAVVPLVMVVLSRDLAAHTPSPRRTGMIGEWRKALAYLRSVPLLRVMATLSILALVTEQFMDFLLMTAAHERYATEASCAGFFGRYYGITSAVTLAVLLLFSGRVLLSLGTSRALLLTPLLTIGVAAAAAIAPTFLTALALRAVDRVMKQSIWSSASEQTQTPLPPVERVQSRALVRGVLAPGAYATTAAALAMLPHGVDSRQLAAATLGGVAIMAVVCVRGVRRAYRDALRRAIDERTLDLDEAEPASFDAETRATLLSELRSSDDRRAGLAAELLCEGSQPPDDQVLDVALRGPSALVRTAALRAVARHRRGRFLDSVALILRDDPEPGCRAEAARVVAQLGIAPEEGRAALARMADEGEALERPAARVALAVLEETDAGNEVDVAELLAKSDDEAATIVLDTLVSVPSEEDRERIERAMRVLLRRGSDAVRLAAASAAARIKASELLPDVVALLPTSLGPEVATRIVEWGPEALAYVQDQVDSAPAESVRHVATALSGEAGGPLLHRLLSHPDPEVRDRAVRSLSYAVLRKTVPQPPDEEIAPLLSQELVGAYKMYAILAGLARDDGIPDWKIDAPFDRLGIEIENEIAGARERVLHLLSLTGKHRLVSAVQAGLRRRSAEVDAKIAELVDATLPRDLSARVVPLFERLSLRERADAARQFADGVSQVERDPLAAIVELGDATILGHAMLVYKERFQQRYPRLYEERASLIPLFERMAFLRTVPIFEQMPGSELRRVAEMLSSVEVPAGEVIFKKGDPGESLYIVRRGAVSIRDGEVELSLAKAGDFFGELALLDNEPRSADAVAAEDAGLARLHGADFRELMARRPQIQERVLRVLVRRLRDASGRITRPS